MIIGNNVVVLCKYNKMENKIVQVVQINISKLYKLNKVAAKNNICEPLHFR